MGPCQETSGFLFDHDCGHPALTQCADCRKPIRSVCTGCSRLLPEGQGPVDRSNHPHYYRRSSPYYDTSDDSSGSSSYDANDFTQADLTEVGPHGIAGPPDEGFEDDMGGS